MKHRENARLPERGGALLDWLLETAYLLLLAFYTLAAFRNTTMLDGAYLEFTWEFSRTMRIVTGLVVAARLARERSWRPLEVLLALAICGSLLRSWERVYRSFVMELAMLMAGAHDIDFGKLLRVHFCAAAAALIATMALALTGVIENLVYYRDGTGAPRMAFGIIYPTDFAAQVFFLTASWGWIRGARITWGELVGMVLLAAFCLVFCGARNSAVCLVLLAAGLAWLKRRRRGSAAYEMRPAARWLCVLAAPLAAAGMIALSRLYDGGPLMDALDRLLSGRLYYGAEAFQMYRVSLFGQEVELAGWGGSSVVGPADAAFFLDSSYVNMLFCFGAATLAAFLAAYTASAWREGKNRSWERLWILAVAALQCAAEHHFIELVYNPFLLLALAASPPEEERPIPRHGGR